MPVFRYESVDKSGKIVSGVIDAQDRQNAARLLQEQGFFPTSITSEQDRSAGEAAVEEEKPGAVLSRALNVPLPFFSAARVSEQDLAVLFRQWSSLISSGLPLIRSLSCIIDQQEKVKMRETLEDIREKVRSGTTLADAMSGHRDVFFQLQIDMVRAGELGGMLETSLTRLADFTEAELDLKNKVKSALIYPAILTSAMVGAIGFLLAFVVPRFVEFFRDIEQTLPLPTLMLIGIGNFMSRFWWTLIILPLAAALGGKSYADTESGRLQIDRMKLKMPILGSLIRKVVISRFARTLSTLVEGGISILTALDIAKDTTGNTAITRALEEVQTSVREGASVTEPLRQTQEFPPLVIHMIAVGEESGKLGEMLQKVSEVYDNEISVAIRRFTSILEPAIILIMAVAVAFVVVAILLPILSMDVIGA